MKIVDLDRFDTVVAEVVCATRDNGCYLKIDELDDANPIVKLYDFGGKIGDRLLVSISKISDDRNYIRARCDSYLGNLYAA